MLSSLPILIIALCCSSNSEFPPVRTENLLKNVFTNLTQSFAQAVQFEMSSAVSQGELRGIKLGSAGSKIRNDIGAASSYGVGQLEFLRISIGVSAAKARTSESVSKVINSQLRRRWREIKFHRFKRDDVNVATSLNQVSGPGAKSVMGSTGISAGPVATSISLGSIFLAARNSITAVNAGSLAAHAGSTDNSNSFSNSNIQNGANLKTRNKNIDETEDEEITEEEELNGEPDKKNEGGNDGGFENDEEDEESEENDDSEDEDTK